MTYLGTGPRKNKPMSLSTEVIDRLDELRTINRVNISRFVEDAIWVALNKVGMYGYEQPNPEE